MRTIWTRCRIAWGCGIGGCVIHNGERTYRCGLDTGQGHTHEGEGRQDVYQLGSVHPLYSLIGVSTVRASKQPGEGR